MSQWQPRHDPRDGYRQPPYAGQWPPRQLQHEPPVHRRRRLPLWAVIIILAGLAGAASAIVPHFTAGPPDYRDPVQLAAAVKSAEQAKGVSADVVSCVRMPAPLSDYICSVASGGTIGTEQVTVSGDGRSWAPAGSAGS
jgi:hypothetical protein